jgi:hypothetical protein
MVMSNATDTAKFLQSAKRVLRQIEAHASTGGADGREASRTEIKLAAARDRLEDRMRPLGVDADPACIEMMSRVKQACRQCSDRASDVRRARNDAEIARIDAEIADARAEAERRNPGLAAYRAELRASCR